MAEIIEDLGNGYGFEDKIGGCHTTAPSSAGLPGLIAEFYLTSSKAPRALLLSSFLYTDRCELRDYL